jgi:phosphoribosylaminoimidazole carboxylase (NCAIR synthetase)
MHETYDEEALLAEIERAGHSVWPSSRTLALVQDKFTQKQALQSAGLPIPRMCAIDDRAAIDAAS